MRAEGEGRKVGRWPARKEDNSKHDSVGTTRERPNDDAFLLSKEALCKERTEPAPKASMFLSENPCRCYRMFLSKCLTPSFLFCVQVWPGVPFPKVWT